MVTSRCPLAGSAKRAAVSALDRSPCALRGGQLLAAGNSWDRSPCLRASLTSKTCLQARGPPSLCGLSSRCMDGANAGPGHHARTLPCTHNACTCMALCVNGRRCQCPCWVVGSGWGLEGVGAQGHAARVSRDDTRQKRARGRARPMPQAGPLLFITGPLPRHLLRATLATVGNGCRIAVL